jgi:hypothetical protein
MLRDFAALREAQGAAADAADLRGLAAKLANDTLSKMYSSTDGKGWFNLIYPPASATAATADTATGSDTNADTDATTNAQSHSSPRARLSATPGKGLSAHEMRHVVDFFSVTFGMCGLTDQPCDFSPQVRSELGNWFRAESVTKTWIRATSPKCNCSNTWEVPLAGGDDNSAGGSGGAVGVGTPGEKNLLPGTAGSAGEWPAYPTCAAGRPDHGSNGAYPSWSVSYSNLFDSCKHLFDSCKHLFDSCKHLFDS